ncbi:MAG: UvrD-helicase domain-containing protein, partial [Turicibacter sp.]|nr:UvrD-helicase domain-containing protein [Turicibacter sp.]
MSQFNIPNKPTDAIWNDEQWQAIYEKGHDLLISAGAGSGKTAVLVERIIQKILLDQINVDELLVLTFTEAAAAEMKQRIRSRIEQELAKQPDHLVLSAQLNKISGANISTFHAFCNKLIRRYYYLLQLDPVFKIADDIEVGILQDDVIESLFDELAEVEDEDFIRLSESFNSDRDDEALKVMILKVYELARSNPNMQQWLMNLSSLYEWDSQDLGSWRYYDEIGKLIAPAIEEAILDLDKARKFASDAEMMGTPHKYPTEIYPEDIAYATRLKESQNATYDVLREAFKNTKLSTFPRFNAKQFDKEAHEQSKAARDSFKKKLGKIEEKYFVYSNETHKRHFDESEKVVRSLSTLVLKFHERFMKAKRERQMLDFSDLEWNTLALLIKDNKPTEVALDIYHQFKEIMIDEYQDTNSMQECIITSIAKVTQPNIPIFMVGDVKQSIYRFRLAEPSI